MTNSIYVDMLTGETFEDNESNVINMMIARSHNGFVATDGVIVAWYGITEEQAIQKLNEIKKEIKLWESQNKCFINN